VELQPLAGSAGRASSSQGASTSYATATGQPSSYARVHGEVSRAPARWRRIDTVAKEQLREVTYEKAVGEGIAKVWRPRRGGAGGSERCRLPASPTAVVAACRAALPASFTAVMNALPRADHNQPAGKAQRLHPTNRRGCSWVGPLCHCKAGL